MTIGEFSVTIKKADLLNIVKKNRAGHQEQYQLAMKGYREQAVRVLTALLEAAQKSVPFNVRKVIELVEPQEHIKDYDRVTLMLEMSTADEIAINEREFSQYVQDLWGWKEQFVATNSRYSS